MNRRARSFTLALGAAATLAAAVGAAAQEQPAADAKIEDSGFNVPADTGYFDLRRITPITGDPARGQARSELCTACHGQDGISIVPIYPDIAGQKADYMYWQLRKFKDAGFGDTVMAVAVEDLTEQDMRDLSLYYAGLPAAGSPPEPAEPEAAPDPTIKPWYPTLACTAPVTDQSTGSGSAAAHTRADAVCSDMEMRSR